MKANKTLVLGATGLVGSVVSKELRAAGHVVRGISRAHKASAGGEEWIALDAANPDRASVEAAFEGVNRAFLLSPPGYANQDTLLAPFIEEAKRRGLEKVVLMTALGVDASEEIPFRKAERRLERSGLPHAILRPNWFMQNFHTFWLTGIKQAGVVLVPGGDARVGFIDARDIGEAAAALLRGEAKGEGTFLLTGPDALTHADAARILSEASGRAIGYVDADPTAFRAALIGAGLPADYADLLLVLFSALRAGASNLVTSDFTRATGRAPRDLTSYARDFRAAWV